MLSLARLPSCSADAEAEPHWNWPWTLVNSIFPLTRRGVFGRISVVEATNINTVTKQDGDYQWFARAVSEKQFLSFALPKIMGKDEDIRIISILPSSGEILAYINPARPEVFKFSPESDAWEPLPPMISSSGPPFPGVVIGDFYYVVGGTNWTVLREAERLDLRTNKWEKITGMHHRHVQGHSFAMDGRLYVVHVPCFRHLKCSSADVFDPATKQWTLVENFLPPDCNNLGLAVVKNEVYMVTWSYAKPQPWIMRYDKAAGKWVFVDFVPHDNSNSRFVRKKRLCPVGNELWVMDCDNRRGGCGGDEIFREGLVWAVFKGPSFCPPHFHQITPQPHKFIHAYRIGGIGPDPAWRTIPVFCL